MPEAFPLKQFVRAFGLTWFTKMSGPLTVPFTFAALFVKQIWLKLLFALLAITCFAVSAYTVWNRERIAKEKAIAELEAATVTPQAPRRDWARDWKELAASFRAEVPHGILATWHKHTTLGESWQLTGGKDAAQRLESLCKHAGDLLIASPKVSRNVSAELRVLPPTHRWLGNLKDKTIGFKFNGSGVETLDSGEKAHIVLGTLPNVAGVSANVCMEYAGEEY